MDESGAVQSPSLIVIGGFAGTGKTTVSRILSSELLVPRLGSDTMGRSIKASVDAQSGEIDAYRVAYDLLFRLCEDFLQCRISVILDITLGWEFQWRQIDEIIERQSRVRFLPIILRCSQEQAFERIRKRHQGRPDYYAPPEVFKTGEKHRNIWNFLQALDRPEVHFVEASGDEAQVYDEVKDYVLKEMNNQTTRL